MKLSTKELVLAALFAGITAVASQIAIPLPFSPVPFNMQLFAVALAGGILGARLGGLALLVYVLLGAVGLPVYSQMNGGISILLGPTGGYLFSFPLAAALIGYTMEKKSKPAWIFTGFFLALGLIYTLGLVQLKFVTGMSWKAAYVAGVGPFIPFDAVKFVTSALLSKAVYQRLRESNLFRWKTHH